MYIRIHVITESKKESIVLEKEDVFTVSVKEPAENNLANKRIIEIIGNYYNITPQKIRIISGHHQRTKLLSVNI